MKVAVLGAQWSPCAEPMDQMVVPATGLPSPSVQVKAVPPHSWTSIPTCRLYHACSAGASLALKKTPPMPVTLFMAPRRSGGREGEGTVCSLTDSAQRPACPARSRRIDGRCFTLLQPGAAATATPPSDDGCA